MKEISTTYDQSQEPKIYEMWESSGYFNPDNLKGEPFTIIMPPLNANASPHVGHALGMTLQDIMIRYQRMLGKKTLWLPGTDHAGFETQVVFEKKLEKEGRSRFQMTREEFYKEVWDFVQHNKHITEEGIKRLGASADWSRNTFTLDPKIVEIVYDTFKQMYADGLVYKGDRICNWCVKHQTNLADLETKYEERQDPLYYIKYGPFVLATVRPETKFGDTALAVNPKDKRYRKYVGQEIEAEGLLGQFKLKVIADDAVDMEFGTGVVKVTPAHDSVDYEIWQRHKDEIPGPKQVIDSRGKMNLPDTKYHGLKVVEARKLVAEDLEKAGLLEKVDKNYKHNVQLCYKCGQLIEPLIMPQWYIAMTKITNHESRIMNQSLRDAAVEAVKKGEVKIMPDRYEKVFMHWMENIRDWPISRKTWWGIAIPVWYCGGVEKGSQKIVGVHPTLVSEWLHGKTRTYRLRDLGFKVGDKLAFEDSGTKKLIGYATMTGIEKTTVGDIALPDLKHSGKYKTTAELIQAFYRMHPDRNDITAQTPAWIYDFEFEPLSKENTADGCGQIILSPDKPQSCPTCSGKNLAQDTDTFDTWFSSGQWPYATLLAQSENSKSKTQNSKSDFKTFYPTQVMETGWDILFFWVARMIMLGLYKTGKVPFETVYLHGLVRDKDRQKMSKSKGNVIDPLGVIDTFGNDALRMALVVGNLPGNDLPLSEDKVRGYRNFANKIWNAARFVMQNTEELRSDLNGKDSYSERSDLLPEDQKILDELQALVADTTRLMDKYDFAHAAENLYHYFWHTFADKVIEESKAKLANTETKASAQVMLNQVLNTCLKLLHPCVPFVTEAVWQMQHKDLLLIQKWPKN